ncbi:adenosylcobinamide-GDP ribazoletransferase, partial [Streptomyces fuscigenes]|nr:adenosylcobinamide-GDP ribazoletransferase [Streptomyces fuscigenes]
MSDSPTPPGPAAASGPAAPSGPAPDPDSPARARASGDPARASLADGIRFAVGTLTVLPVRVTRWDGPAARLGMLCAPLAGLAAGAA